MTPPGLPGVLLGLLLGGLLLLTSAVGLSRIGPAAPEVVPLGRLRLWDLLLAGLGLLLMPALAAMLLYGDEEPSLMPALMLQAAVALLVWAYLRLRAGGFPAAAPTRHGAGWALLAYLLALPGYLAVAGLNALLLRLLGAEPPQQEVVRELEVVVGTGTVPAILLAVLALPFLEELLFRGYLFRCLAAREEFGPRRALLLSALTFMLFHESQVWLPILYLGLLFGWIYWRSGSLAGAWLAHALHNGLGMALVQIG